jgi:septal ring factor EnvC (AmiA/AmiB activator)
MKFHTHTKVILALTTVVIGFITAGDKIANHAHAALAGINDPNREANVFISKIEQSLERIKTLEQNLAQINATFINFKTMEEQRIEKLEKTIATINQSYAIFVDNKALQEQRTLILERRLTCMQQALRSQEQLTKIREAAVNCN